MKLRAFLILIFILATGLRLWLGFVNRSANDDHISVINLIVDQKVIPEKEDCWSCYQPKLYYLIASGFVKMFHYKMQERRIMTAQVLNVLFGFLILLIFWKFLKRKLLDERSRLFLFAFFALNPCLAAINIQHTNDTLAILCGIAALYFADIFFSNPQRRYFIWLALSAVACALTKGSGLIIFMILFLVFAIKIFAQRLKEMKLQLLKYGLIFTLGFLLVVPFAGGYYHNYKKYGSATLSGWNRDPAPKFFDNTPIARPGIKNLYSGWFTFRYFELIKYPYISNEPEPFPVHRTSLWSQLYGRTMFLHFDQWPQPWQSTEPFILNVGRGLILLGIVPLMIFLFGIAVNIKRVIFSFRTGFRSFLIADTGYMHLLAAASFLGSSLFYSYYFRDFSAMKSIYIFPGLLSFIKLFLDGYIRLSNKKMRFVINVILVIICLLFITDLSYLLRQHLLPRNTF